MKRRLGVVCAGVIIGVLLCGAPALALGTEEVRKLQQAGVSDETIAAMVKEKSHETRALMVDEVVRLKAAGVSEETVRMLIEESSFLKDRKPVVYGNSTKTLRVNTAADIIALKDSGLSDEVIQAIIIAGAQDRGAAERQKAWEMLKNMEIILDQRERK